MAKRPSPKIRVSNMMRLDRAPRAAVRLMAACGYLEPDEVETYCSGRAPIVQDEIRALLGAPAPGGDPAEDRRRRT